MCYEVENYLCIKKKKKGKKEKTKYSREKKTHVYINIYENGRKR